jgi:inositol hexakisphosphate/diphosphoinositol-pentakisphosphate kinase
MKLMISEPRYLEYFHNYSQSATKDLKVKSRAALVRFLEITREVVADPVVRETKTLWRKLKQIQDVLERWEISGINRKLQMKPERLERIPVPGFTSGISESDMKTDTLAAPVGEVRAVEVLLILKWGGDLTLLGRQQAEELGERFRYQMYPDAGGGMLRLHATYRHDLKIKASDEGRVMKTAAAFAKGLLELEGQLTPILASLVTVEEKSRQMLDREGNREIKQEMDRCKEHLHLLQRDTEMSEELVHLIAPDCSSAAKKAMMDIENPVKALQRMHSLIGHLCDQLRELIRIHGEFDSNEITPCESPAHILTQQDDFNSTVKPFDRANHPTVQISDDVLKVTMDVAPSRPTSPRIADFSEPLSTSVPTNGVKLYMNETLSLMAGKHINASSTLIMYS